MRLSDGNAIAKVWAASAPAASPRQTLRVAFTARCQAV